MKGITAYAAAVLSASTAFATPLQPRQGTSLVPITVKGNAFFQGDKRFYVRGVDYQPGGSSKIEDPIAEPEVCKRDIAEFKKLGINTVRIYSVDNSQSHDECMQALADAGIYLVLDVNTPKYSINRAAPDISYNAMYLQNVFATIDIFAKYSNTLAFFSGNEVINDAASTNCAPFVKATTRDIRKYLSARSYRQIPTGYSAADVSENRKEMAEYMNCGSTDERSDFFAFNDYSWCDPSSLSTSGWDQKVKNFSDYSIPLFLSEWGCNTNKRTFGAAKALYSTDMSAVFSGGLVYEYSEEGSKYGIVDISGGSVKELDDFTALKDAYASAPDPSGDGGYKANGQPSKCPARSSLWDVKNSDLPLMPDGAKKYMTEGAGKGVGFSGLGSQTAGTPNPQFAPSGSGGNSVKGSTKKAAASSVSAPAFSVMAVVGLLAAAAL
ncbi:MAG: beta-glucanosyltransferase [Vezdaea aestivalis]|nr:MAG: beta-glucanosyltransferase [Vezdaea aestivalis]